MSEQISTPQVNPADFEGRPAEEYISAVADESVEPVLEKLSNQTYLTAEQINLNEVQRRNQAARYEPLDPSSAGQIPQDASAYLESAASAYGLKGLPTIDNRVNQAELSMQTRPIQSALSGLQRRGDSFEQQLNETRNSFNFNPGRAAGPNVTDKAELHQEIIQYGSKRGDSPENDPRP